MIPKKEREGKEKNPGKKGAMTRTEY